jgi:prevent-host-death family protein
LIPAAVACTLASRVGIRGRAGFGIPVARKPLSDCAQKRGRPVRDDAREEVTKFKVLRDYRDLRIFRDIRRLHMRSTATAGDVSKNFGAYQDAAVRAPVIITKNGRPRTVLMAYEDFVRLSKRDRRVQRTVDLSEAEVAAVETAEMAPEVQRLARE